MAFKKKLCFLCITIKTNFFLEAFFIWERRDEMEDFISIMECQKMLGCCTTTIYKIVHSDGFPTLTRRGLKQYMLSKSEFLKWCKKNGYIVKEI